MINCNQNSSSDDGKKVTVSIKIQKYMNTIQVLLVMKKVLQSNSRPVILK